MGRLLTMMRKRRRRAVDLLTGLEAYYRFDGTGTDTSGHGRHADTGFCTFAAGVLGASLKDELGGNGAGASGLGELVTYSVSAWLYDAGGATPDGNGPNVALADVFGAALVTVSLYGDSNGNVAPKVEVVPPDAVTGSPVPAGGTWFHLAAVAVGGGDVTFYVNGAAVGTVLTPAAGVDWTTVYPYSADWPGWVDEVGVWSRALSAAEITQLYNGGVGFDPTA